MIGRVRVDDHPVRAVFSTIRRVENTMTRVVGVGAQLDDRCLVGPAQLPRGERRHRGQVAATLPDRLEALTRPTDEDQEDVESVATEDLLERRGECLVAWRGGERHGDDEGRPLRQGPQSRDRPIDQEGTQPPSRLDADAARFFEPADRCVDGRQTRPVLAGQIPNSRQSRLKLDLDEELTSEEWHDVGDRSGAPAFRSLKHTADRIPLNCRLTWSWSRRGGGVHTCASVCSEFANAEQYCQDRAAATQPG